MEVKVIERKQASGNRTLYLEYYETGFRKRENLHLTLYPEDGNTKLAKINKETRHQAEVILSERILNPPSWLFKDPEEDAEEHVDERTATLTWAQWALDYAELGEQEGKTFMIYDLGGGTFDVSIMKVKGGDLVTLSTDGDHHLGGVDWDTELVN